MSAATATKTFVGSVHGGQQPVTGANMILYAVGQTGDGSAATSLMTSAVTTDSNGNFVLTGHYSCPTPTTAFPGQVYLVAVGGNPGLGTGKTNPNLTLMAALGLCSELTSSTYIFVNELTTVASVAALAPFMSSYAAVGSGSSDAASLDAAMTLVNEYVNTTAGTVPGAGLPSGYTAPSATLISLADAMAACVNTSGGSSGDGSACGKLFLYATDSGSVPTETVGAVLNILNNPLNELTQIYGLVGSSPPFASGLTGAPSTWALPILASGNGTLALAASSYTVNEDGLSVTLAVTRTEGDTGAVSVNYATADGTATAGTDYTSTGGTLNWANGDSSAKTLTVPITDASVYGGTRAFTVSLSATGGGATLGVTTSATVTIDDSDVQTSYYVATTGNDTTGTGTMAAPFATLARAQTAMRAGSIKTTQIESGTYYLTTPLALTSSDNGESWEAAPGATPVISGGVAVTGWTSAGGGIWTAPLSVAAGIDLEINGIRQYPAALGWDPFRPFMTGWHVVNYNATTSGQVMNVYAADLTASAQTVGNVIQYTDTTRYTDWFGTVSAYSSANDTVTIQGNRVAPSSGVWRILGDYRDVTVPGQFGYNATTQQLYVMPTSSCGFGTNSVATSAQLGSLITVSSVSGLTISGLTFSDTISPRVGYTDYSGVAYNTLPLGTIEGTALTNSSIGNNRFVNVGNGISLTSSTGNSIAWNSFDQLGGTAISLKTQSNNNLVQHNTMTSLGRINAGSYGVYIQSSADVTVDSNYIYGAGRNAVSVAINDTTSTYGLQISNNLVVSTSQQTNDTAAIYLYAGNNSTQVNISSTITGNRVENTGGLLTNNMGNYVFAQNRGIYNDDKVSGVTLTDNVTENNMQGILLCHGCTANAANNNVAILQSQPIYANYQGTTSSATGAMTLNGTTSIALAPSYFPASVDTSVIVVQLSGASTGTTQPQFNVLADGNVIGSGSVSTSGTIAQFVYTANLTPRTMHTIGVQLTNGANTGNSTQSLANMFIFVNNTLVPLNASFTTESGMQVLSDSGTNQPNVSDFSYNRNIVYRGSGSGMDASLYFQANGYTDPSPGTINYNLMWNSSLTKASTSPGASYETGTLDANSLVQNPLFLNATIGDYTLESNSPAYGLGFTTSGVPLAPAASYPATAVSGCTVY